MKITLQYLTDTGSRWLEQAYDVNESNYQNIIDSHFKNRETSANFLERKWHLNGEDVTLSPNVELGKGELGGELFKKIFSYVSNL